ncbi:hypothetical protein [Yoonia sp. I 8.24]|uniref:hypothetical protein n=1 Tax=Yoonia sp. I 8.24 TaxID=1537229 RepID=UPI001EE10853|nr:hypothetical protein [Yoonia sp. I 8.24]
MISTLFKTLGRQYLDVTLRSGPEMRVRIIERPGVWMDEAQLAALSADLRTIAARTLEAGSLTYGVFSGDATRMKQVVITLVTRADGTPIAFNALAIMAVDMEPVASEVLHLGLVMVDPDERSKNLSWVLYGLTCFLIFFRRQFRPVWISNVTQVPAVVGMVSQMFSGVWPQPNGNRRTLNHLLLARQIMAQHRDVFGVGPEAGFNEEKFIITDAYTGGSDDLKKTWDAAPKHRDAQYNDFCAATLDYARGDDVIQLGQMDLAAMRQYLRREVPKSAVFGLLLAGGLVALRRIVLPAVHWADSTKHWKTLRPHNGAQE